MCVCVCVYVCMYVCMYVCISIDEAETRGGNSSVDTGAAIVAGIEYIFC